MYLWCNARHEIPVRQPPAAQITGLPVTDRRDGHKSTDERRNQMSDKPKNPQAYPSLGNVGYQSEWQTEEGMTLRDYFAGQALVGMLSLMTIEHLNEVTSPKEMRTDLASAVYLFADAMLKEREE